MLEEKTADGNVTAFRKQHDDLIVRYSKFLDATSSLSTRWTSR